jgi:hypothetical protein
MALSWTMASAILDEILARALDGATGDGPALGEIFVITHASAIAV